MKGPRNVTNGECETEFFHVPGFNRVVRSEPNKS